MGWWDGQLAVTKMDFLNLWQNFIFYCLTKLNLVQFHIAVAISLFADCISLFSPLCASALRLSENSFGQSSATAGQGASSKEPGVLSKEDADIPR